MNDDQQSKPPEPTELTNEWGAQPSSESQDQPQAGAFGADSFGNENAQSAPIQSVQEVPVQADQSFAPEMVTPRPFAPPAQPQPVQQPQATAPIAVPPAPGYGAQPGVPQMVQNPGQTLGIVSIVLGVFLLWFVGIPLAIVSIVKSSKVKASKALGIVGLVLNILAIVVSAFLILVTIVAYNGIKERAEEATVTSTSISSNLISLDTYYTPTSGSVYFAVPATISGWTITTLDQEGVNKFTKDDNTASFMSYQGVLSGLNGTDREVTVAAMNEYVSKLEATAVSGSDSTISIDVMSNNKQLEFMTRQVTMTSEGKTVDGIVAVRMYEGHEPSIIYLADPTAFNKSEWTSLTSKLSINDGVL